MAKLNTSAVVLTILIIPAVIIHTATVGSAQTTLPAQVQSGQTNQQVPQPVGGVATVIGVDQPENCLRIRSGPGSSYDVIGCAGLGQQLNITGVWTTNGWAQLSDNGWVYGPQIQTDLRPPQAALTQEYNDAELEYSDYPLGYAPDTYYLPNYGYTTYWYGGIPLFLYNVNVWRRYHPWWWKKGHRVWNQGPYRRWAPNVRSGTPGHYGPRRSTPAAFNVNRFNARGFGVSPSNTVRPPRTFSGSGTMRSFSSPNVMRGAANVGGRSVVRSGMAVSGGARPGGSSFRSMGVSAGRSFSGGGFRGASHFGGGGHRR